MHSLLQNIVLWKALTAILLAVVIVGYFENFDHEWLPYRSARDTINDLGYSDGRQQPSKVSTPWRWRYEWQRDRDNHGLSESQCNKAFPDLYHEIDRATDHWRDRIMTPNTTDLGDGNEAGVRILLAYQQLRILETRGMWRSDFRLRIMAVLHQLHRAITSVEAIDDPFDDMEFTVVVDDFPTMPQDEELALWSFTRAYENQRHDSVWVMPDFNFFSAPPVAGAFPEMQALARTHDMPVANKTQKALWRGVRWTAPKLRGALIDMTKGKTWADVQTIDWRGDAEVIPLQEYCRYAFLLNTEGRSWSSRLTHILNCDSVPVVHEVKWAGHYYHLLKPDGSDRNIIPVQRDFSDLEEQIQHYIDYPERAQVVADNARRIFRERYTTPAATACYWRRLLRSWSSMAYSPSVYEEVEMAYQSFPKFYKEKRMRGIAFEEFLLHNTSKDYPYD